MTTHQLERWHGAGNEFLVIFETALDADAWTPVRAAACLDTLGGDGLLVGVYVGGPLSMTLFNRDGSRAEMSGNGIRCLAAAWLKDAQVSEDTLAIFTDAGPRVIKISLDGDLGYGEVDMGPVSLDTALDGSLGVANVGNPHVVVRDDAAWSDQDREERAIGLSDLLGGANVEFVTVQSNEHVRMTVFERGVGWTKACGTGSVAAAAVLHSLGEVADKVTISNPGGDLVVTLVEDRAVLAGPVQFVDDVTWETE